MGTPKALELDENVVTFSDPILDRKSVFIGCFIPIEFHEQLMPSIEKIKNDVQFSMITADHKIAAWRLKSHQKKLSFSIQEQSYLPSEGSDCGLLIETGSDDDGEKGGGRTIEKMLPKLDIIGLVIVSRWWGGVLLGPVRFDYIRDCTFNAVQKFRQQNALKTVSGNFISTKQTEINLSQEKELTRLRNIYRSKMKTIELLRKKIADLLGKSHHDTKLYSIPSNIETLKKIVRSRDKTIEKLRSVYSQISNNTEISQRI